MNDTNPSTADPLGQIADEFVEAFRQGKRPSVEAFARRYPEQATEIREMLPALVLMEKAKAPDDTPVQPRLAATTPLQQLGDYQILREVGRGGMGVVYEAQQLSLGRHVAIKVLPAHALLDARQLGRFQREARSAAKLHHTNIVPVFGVGEQDGLHYYVMQFIPGLGLDVVLDELRRLRQTRGKQAPTQCDRPGHTPNRVRDVSAVARGLLSGEFRPSEPILARTITPADASPGASAPGDPGTSSACVADTSATIHLPGQTETSTLSESGRKYWQSVARVGVQVADALAHAASQGILHRDIKPSNLLLDDTGNVWVTDFGLAKADTDGDDLTHTGDVVGTLRYMAPERFSGQGDLRSDTCSLGLTLYELLTLRPAFDETDRNRLVKQVVHDDPVRPRKLDPSVPRDLETVVLKAIARDPAHRYQTPAEMAEDLKRFVEDRPVKARRIGVAEQLWRWCRRNPSIAALGGALATVLILVTVASLLAAGHFNRLRLNEAQAAQNERDARQAEALQRARAEAEKKRADVTLADTYTARGLLAGERDAAAEAVLWFAAAADQSATAEDAQRQTDNQMRARNWMRQATLPVAAMSLAGHVRQLDFQPRGYLLLLLSDNDVVFWSWRDGKRLPWADELAGVSSAQFSPDGASVALGFHSGEAQIRKVSDGERLATLHPEGGIGALAFSPDGKLLALAGERVRVWDINGKAFLAPAWSHPQAVTALVFNRKGDRLITACADKLARVFSVESRQDHTEPLYPPVAHTVATPPALIEEDRTLVTVSGGVELTRWDMATGKPASTPIRTTPSELEGVVASPDGNWFATAGNYGPELYAADARQPPVYLSHTNLVKSFVFSPDSTTLLSVSWDQTARLWSLPRGRPLGQPLKHMAIGEGCAWSHDSRHFVTVQHGGLIRVWQRPVDDPVIAQEFGWGLKTRPRVSFDGRLVVPGFWHEAPFDGRHQHVNRLRVVNTADGQPTGADIPLPGALVDSCVCGDNRAVAAVLERGGSGLLGVWNVATGRARFEPIPLPGLPIAVAARPGSGQLAVSCATGDLLVVDDRTGKSVLELHHEGLAAVPSGDSVQVQYTPDGETLVSIGGTPTSTVNVRDADSGRLRFTLRSSVDGSNFHGFSLSPDSRLLATTGLVKNHVQVWELATGHALSQPLPHPGDYWGLFSVRFSPDGRHLLTSHKDGQVRYWDWRAGKLACPPMGHDDETHDAVITPDGRFALTVIGGRPEFHVWELTTGRRVAPPVRLSFRERAWCLALAITPDARRALIGLWMDLAVLDLDALLAPPPTPTADLALLAELATAQRIELGGLSGLTTEQWQERWGQLRERNPDLGRSIHSEPRPATAARQRTADAVACFDRAEGHTRQGRWKEAAGELARLARMYPADARFRIWLANLLLQSDDSHGYRKLCEDTAKGRDGLPFDPTVANNTVWLFCLSPGAVPDYTSLVTLAERAVKESPNEHDRLVHLNTLGVILFRAGRYQEAIDRLNERTKAGEASGAPVDWVFLAMAHHSLNNKAEANRWLDRFRDYKVADLRTSKDLWNDLELTLFAREAEARFRAP